MQRLANGGIAVVDSPLFLEIVLVLCAGGFGAGAWLQLQHDPPKYFIAAALIAAALICIASVLYQKKKTYLFDPSIRKLTWTSRGLFRSEAGELPFQDISDVRIERNSDSGGYTYRVAIVTPIGPMPLSNAFVGNEKRVAEDAASIVKLIGGDQSKPIQVFDPAQAFLTGGAFGQRKT